jgi:hypothetical protein
MNRTLTSTRDTSRMTIKEARSVYWLKNNHRSLGELLDEGYLNESRLVWAAENAYDPQLKEAAGVLLHHLRRRKKAAPTAQRNEDQKPVIEAKITVDEARATLWPFRPYKDQPMGELSDTRRLSLKDLAYAVQEAWDRRVRQAAIVLLAQRLQQAVEEPEPPAGPLNVVSAGRSFSEERALAWKFFQGMGVGVVLAIGLGILGLSIREMFRQPLLLSKLSQAPVLIIITVVLLILAWLVGRGIGRLLDLFMDKTEEQIENSYRGQQGEDQVVEAMRQNLDGEWTLFRNLTLPGHNEADIDAVLVGPSGVWALEIKNYTGEYRNRGETWEYKAGKRWKLLKKSPSSQAARNAARLHDFLRADGIRQWVDKAVIWANPENPPEVKDQAVAVWTFDRLSDELGNLQQQRKLDEEQKSQIVEKLTTLCERNAEVDETRT